MLTLRKLIESDADLLAQYANNKKIWDNLRDMMPHPYTLQNAKEFIQAKKDQIEDYVFVIEYDGSMAGMIGLHPQKDIYRKSLELGYWVAEPYWGKGIASEAVSRILEFAKSLESYNRVFAGVLEHNAASRRVLEKNQFKFEGIAIKAAIKNNLELDEWRYALVW